MKLTALRQALKNPEDVLSFAMDELDDDADMDDEDFVVPSEKLEALTLAQTLRRRKVEGDSSFGLKGYLTGVEKALGKLGKGNKEAEDLLAHVTKVLKGL